MMGYGYSYQIAIAMYEMFYNYQIVIIYKYSYHITIESIIYRSYDDLSIYKLIDLSDRSIYYNIITII